MEVYNDQSTVLDDKGLYEVIPNGKKFYFTLKNSKGVLLCQSPDFVSKTSCITGLENFKVVVYEGVFYICKDKNGKFQLSIVNQVRHSLHQQYNLPSVQQFLEKHCRQ